MIHRRELRPIRLELPRMIHLRRHRSHPLLMQHRRLLRQGAHTQSAGAPVITHSAVRSYISYVVVIDVPDHGRIHVSNRPVVIELSMVPVTAVVTVAYIPEAIVNAAVETNVIAPESMMILIPATVESPVRRRPERAYIRRNYPHARYPVISRGSIAPIAGSPEIVRPRTRRLAVFGQWRRRLSRLHNRLTLRVIGCIDGIVRICSGILIIRGILRRRRSRVLCRGSRSIRGSRRIRRRLRLRGCRSQIAVRRIARRRRGCIARRSLIRSRTLAASRQRDAHHNSQPRDNDPVQVAHTHPPVAAGASVWPNAVIFWSYGLGSRAANRVFCVLQSTPMRACPPSGPRIPAP